MKDLISVIVPVFNAEKYLERCILSIRSQTYENLEILLINDGSTDNSGALCQSFANEDKRIRVFHQKNGGSSLARNTGLDNAGGTIISFLDSDDHIDPTMLETMYELMDQHDLEVVEIERDDLTGKKTFTNSFKIEDKTEALKRIIPSSSFQVWKRIYKKSLINDMRFIPKIIHQDVFFTIDLLNRIESIGYLNSALYFYNRDSDSVIRSKYTPMKRDIAIRATEYIRDNVPKTMDLLKVVDQYTVNYYTDHFYLLSKNSFLDSEKTYRKKLKKYIGKSARNANQSLRSRLIMYLPIPIVEVIALVYEKLKTHSTN